VIGPVGASFFGVRSAVRVRQFVFKNSAEMPMNLKLCNNQGAIWKDIPCMCICMQIGAAGLLASGLIYLFVTTEVLK
jgi:hypothetical protein